MGMISQYLNERAKWARFGKPLRDQEEMNEIFKICEQCPMFQRASEDSGKCGVCGCNIKKTGTFLNKIAWATTKCPIIGSPKWVESKPEFAREVEITKTELLVAEQEMNNEIAQEKNPPKKGGCGCRG